MLGLVYCCYYVLPPPLSSSAVSRALLLCGVLTCVLVCMVCRRKSSLQNKRLAGDFMTTREGTRLNTAKEDTMQPRSHDCWPTNLKRFMGHFVDYS